MRLKTFSAATMSEAMSQVREALGEDAIIVASQEEAGAVRLTAAIEASPEPESGDGGAGGPLGGTGEAPDIAEEIGDALYGHGVPPGLTDRLLDLVGGFDTADPVLALAGAFDSLVEFKPLPQEAGDKPLMFIGPPGAGKTVATAKLATRAHLAGAKVGVISADPVRAGGVEQLAAFTRILDVELLTAHEPEELARAVDKMAGCGLTLIDGPGLNHFVDEDMAELGELLGAADVEPVLVMPAGGDAAEAAEVCTRFAELGAQRLFVTRLDLVRRLGSVLAMVEESGLQFSDVSASAHVAEGLTALNPKKLARLFLPDAEPHQDRQDRTGTQG